MFLSLKMFCKNKKLVENIKLHYPEHELFENKKMLGPHKVIVTKPYGYICFSHPKHINLTEEKIFSVIVMI